jgi:NAD+-processing family protein with receiver domain
VGRRAVRRLVIDDLRVFEFDATYARSPEFGLHLLLNCEWDEVYLDHDMGARDTKAICATLEAMAEEDREPPIGKVLIITANPVAAEWMRRALWGYDTEVIPFIKCEQITLSESIDFAHHEHDLLEKLNRRS